MLIHSFYYCSALIHWSLIRKLDGSTPRRPCQTCELDLRVEIERRRKWNAALPDWMLRWSMEIDYEVSRECPPSTGGIWRGVLLVLRVYRECWRCGAVRCAAPRKVLTIPCWIIGVRITGYARLRGWHGLGSIWKQMYEMVVSNCQIALRILD